MATGQDDKIESPRPFAEYLPISGASQTTWIAVIFAATHIYLASCCCKQEAEQGKGWFDPSKLFAYSHRIQIHTPTKQGVQDLCT